jgi:signal transduction histidine kinase
MLAAAFGASAFWSLHREHDQAVRDAGIVLEGTARSAATGTSRPRLEIDAMPSGMERIVATVSPTTGFNDLSLRTVLDPFSKQSVAVSDTLISYDNRYQVNQADKIPGGAPNSSARGPEKPPALFIAAQEPNPAGGTRLIMLSRPPVRGGTRVGITGVEVPVATFGALFDAIEATGDARIALQLDNGLSVAGQSDRDFAASLLARAAGEEAGLIDMPADAEGGLQAIRRIPALPLVAPVARGRVEILRRWYHERGSSLIGLALFAPIAAGLAWLAVRASRRGQFGATYQRRSEARLKRQSTLLQSTFDNIGEGLSVFDNRGRLIARNLRFCDLLGLPADLALGTPLRKILMWQTLSGAFGDVDPQAEVARRLEQFFRDVPAVRERVTPNGRTLQIRRSAMPDGAVVSVYSDVTQLRAGEHKLLQARSQAELANHSKSEFLANMSHELRTPLNAIIGFTEIISQELFGPIANEKYLEYMKDVHASSLHLLSIINDVLDMSKIEAGKLELEKETVILQDVIANVIRIVHERAGSRGIALSSQAADEPLLIWADERAMKQIFLNLLSNAIKFSAEGGRVCIRLRAEQADFAVIEVEDHGIGMDQDEQQRAMQAFGQAKPSTTRNYGGTGLGLPITRGLVEAHGGTLKISSRAGEGTTVRVVLPMQPANSIFEGKSGTGLDAAQAG